MLDLIGDIHGHAAKLEALLRKLGYNAGNGTYHHPSHSVVFVGDYIDRGPHIPEVLDIVRRMVDSGNAIALMGNHEYNALCYHVKGPDGHYLRPHTMKNTHQHSLTLQQFHGRSREYEEWITWFRTLPLFYETEHFRAVHAMWDHSHIGHLIATFNGVGMTDDLLLASTQKDSLLFTAIDDTLKGREYPIPEDEAYLDNDGNLRTDMRIRWWEQPLEYYNPDQKPLFFGHYWQPGEPSLMSSNLCCLDFGVARNGHLVAYRYNGEKRLDKKNFIFV